LFYDETGNLVASVVQESLMRTMRDQRDQPSQ
jgi:acyl-CoA thioesterase